MRKGNRLAAMIMAAALAAVLAAGAVTGPVFAADYTTRGEILSEQGSCDFLSETGGLTAEASQEESVLSTDPAYEADGSVSEFSQTDAFAAKSADGTTDSSNPDAFKATDPAVPEDTLSEAEKESEEEEAEAETEGTETEAEEEEAEAEGTETENVVENGEDAETPDHTGASADETNSSDGFSDRSYEGSFDESSDGSFDESLDESFDGSFDESFDGSFDESFDGSNGSCPIYETEDVSSGITDDENIISEKMLDGEQETETINVPILGDQDNFNPISVDVTSMELVAGQTGQIYVVNSNNDSSYYEEMTSVQSSDSSVLEAKSYKYQYIELFARKPGTAKVTIEGSYGTALTIEVKVVSFLGKNSVTIKAESKTTTALLEVDSSGTITDPSNNHYSVSSSNKNAAAGSIVKDENDRYYVLKIQGISPGSAVITVKDNDNGSMSTVSVKVEKPTFSLNATEISFKASNVYNLKSSGSNIKTAVSSNTSIVTTEKTGDRTVRLKPVKPGKATVTVTNYFGDVKKATVTVTTFLRFKSMALTAGTKREFSEADIFSASDYQKWGKSFTISDKSIATVSGKTSKNSYIFTGQYPGKTTITVKCGKTGATVPIAVTVKAPAFNLSASKVTIDKVKTWQVTASGSDIGKVSSSNTGILKVKKVSSGKAQLIPVDHGKATVTITSIYGVRRTVTVTVSYNYFKALLTAKTRPASVTRGSTVLTGKTAPSATVSVPIGGKTYTCKADSSGNYKIQKVPAVKAGAKLKLTFKLGGTSIIKTVTVK